MIVYDGSALSTSPGAVQFENANEGRSYPFADNSVLEAAGGIRMGDHVITDMHLVVPRGADAYLSSVYISEHLVSVCVRVMEDDCTVASLSCTVSADRLEPYMPYRLEKTAGSQDVGGVVAFGPIDLASDQGVYRFGGDTVKLADSAVAKYAPARLRRIIDDRTGESLSGDVAIEFSGYVEASREADGVRLGLDPDSDRLLLPKCDRQRSANPCGAAPVQRINGVLPDVGNRIVIWFH